MFGFFQCLLVCHSVPCELAETSLAFYVWGWSSPALPCRSPLPLVLLLGAAALLAPAQGVKQLSVCIRTCARNLLHDATPNNKFLTVEGK